MVIMSDTAAILIQILKEQCLRGGFGGCFVDIGGMLTAIV
jgi:hypothetical protein